MLESNFERAIAKPNPYFSTSTRPLITRNLTFVGSSPTFAQSYDYIKPVSFNQDYDYCAILREECEKNIIDNLKKAYDELINVNFKEQEKGEDEIMLNPNMAIPTIDHFEVYNSVAMKVYFKDYKDKNDYVKVTVQKDKNGVPYDDFDMERGLYLAIVKKLFKGQLTGAGIEEYAKQLQFLVSANKEVKRAIKVYNEEQAEIAKQKKMEEDKKKGFERRKAKKIAKKAEKREREREDNKQFVKDCVTAIQKEMNKKED